MKCLRCGYEWEGKKEKPKSCPKCKRYDWDEEKEGVHNEENSKA